MRDSMRNQERALGEESIHRSAWKGHSLKSISTILHEPAAWHCEQSPFAP
jgi:hypothetical protein